MKFSYCYDHPDWWKRHRLIAPALDRLNPNDSMETWWQRHVEWPALYIEEGGGG